MNTPARILRPWLLLISLLILSSLDPSPAAAAGPLVLQDTVIAPQPEHGDPTADAHKGRESRVGKMSALAIVGFVLAILVPPVGIVVSAIALHHVRKNHMRGRDLALAGIIVGASIIGAYLIALAVYGILWLLFFQFL